MTKIRQLYFSANHKTKEIVEYISSHFEDELVTYDLLRNPLDKPLVIDNSDLVIVGMPVYSGRIPAHYVEMLKQLQGNNTPTIIVVTYGNREYEDALLELRDVMESRHFTILSAGAFIAQHSIFKSVASKRPDIEDKKLLKEFALQSKKLYQAYNPENKTSILVKGNIPYRVVGKGTMYPTGDNRCISCNACVDICPMQAIVSDTPKETNTERCISCTACIKVCPTNARQFHVPNFKEIEAGFKEKNKSRKEPDMFYSTSK